MDIYKSFSISIGKAMRTPEILKFVSDRLITKKMCKHAVKKLPYLLKPHLLKLPYLLFLVNIRLNKCVVKLF